MTRALAACAFAATLVFGITGAAGAATMAASKPSPKPTMSPQTAQLLALVKATPKLKIDKSIPPSDAFDAKTSPYIAVLGVPEGQAVGGYLAGSEAHRGTLKDGDNVIAVPLESGGSGGVFTQIVFAQHQHAAYVYVGYISSGGHLDVRVRDGAIVATLPYYGPNDANCCPSKFIVQTYAIAAGKLKQTGEKTVPTPKPSH